MTKTTIPEPPGDLSDASRALWPRLVADVAAVWDQAPAEVQLIALGDLLRVRDRLDAIAVQLAADGVAVAGSTGQRAANPLVAVEARLRAEWAEGVRALGLRPVHDVTTTSSGRLRRRDR